MLCICENLECPNSNASVTNSSAMTFSRELTGLINLQCQRDTSTGITLVDSRIVEKLSIVKNSIMLSQNSRHIKVNPQDRC